MCKLHRPPGWFWVDNAKPCGRAAKCRQCRGHRSKRVLVEPDYDTIPTSRVKVIRKRSTRITTGGWERVVRRAATLAPTESVRIWCGSDYYSHQVAAKGLMSAAQRMNVPLRVDHGVTEVYVRPHVWRK